jgi:hypothetical protein
MTRDSSRTTPRSSFVVTRRSTPSPFPPSAELAKTLAACSHRLGVKPEEVRDAFGSLLGVVIGAGIDARTARLFLFTLGR